MSRTVLSSTVPREMRARVDELAKGGRTIGSIMEEALELYFKSLEAAKNPEAGLPENTVRIGGDNADARPAPGQPTKATCIMCGKEVDTWAKDKLGRTVCWSCVKTPFKVEPLSPPDKPRPWDTPQSEPAPTTGPSTGKVGHQP